MLHRPVSSKLEQTGDHKECKLYDINAILLLRRKLLRSSRTSASSSWRPRKGSGFYSCPSMVFDGIISAKNSRRNIIFRCLTLINSRSVSLTSLITTQNAANYLLRRVLERCSLLFYDQSYTGFCLLYALFYCTALYRTGLY